MVWCSELLPPPTSVHHRATSHTRRGVSRRRTSTTTGRWPTSTWPRTPRSTGRSRRSPSRASTSKGTRTRCGVLVCGRQSGCSPCVGYCLSLPLVPLFVRYSLHRLFSLFPFPLAGRCQPLQAACQHVLTYHARLPAVAVAIADGAADGQEHQPEQPAGLLRRRQLDGLQRRAGPCANTCAVRPCPFLSFLPLSPLPFLRTVCLFLSLRSN